MDKEKNPNWGGKRDGAGRKSELDMPVRKGVIVEMEQYKKAKSIMTKEKISWNELVRRALKRFLK